jgi:hypothetical protein
VPFKCNLRRYSAGTWRMAFVSDELRVLYTNQGNVFVLSRCAP